MKGFENHAGFAVSESRLQIVEVIQKDDKFILENIDEAFFNEPVDFDSDKETKISALMQGAFNEILIRKPLLSSAVSFTLPFSLFKTAQIPYDNSLQHNDLLELFRWELSVLYPYVSSKDLAIQYIEVEKNDFINTNTAIVIAVERRYLQLFQNFCNKNSLKLKFIDNVHFASERALTLNTDTPVNGLLLSVYLNGSYISAIFSSAGRPVYYKLLPYNQAGEIPGLLSGILHPAADFNINTDAVEAAYLTGEDVSRSVLNALSSSTGIQFQSFNPFSRLSPEPKLFGNKYYTELSGSFSPAAGIAFRLA